MRQNSPFAIRNFDFDLSQNPPYYLIDSYLSIMAADSCNKSCSQCFNLLGDSTRLQIFTKIRAGIDQVKRLEKELAVSQPTISHHVRLLTEYGLITATKQGRETKYSYNNTFACHNCLVFTSDFK
jgi:DNA-binding transcriptional ArsR family regulator